jgi:CubicO group peptidase (beta-lactamase class C family)
MRFDVAGFEDFVRREMGEWKVPGAAVCLRRGGETLLRAGFGLRDLASGEPVDTDTVFWIASNTKAMAGLSVALLAEEGRLDLDAPLRSSLPDLRMYDSHLTELLNARDLLTHRTGISAAYDRLTWDPANTREDLFEKLRYLRPCRPFRSAYQYNNLQYAIAGHVVERITGTGWESFVSERIFQPIGMRGYDFSFWKRIDGQNRSRRYRLAGDEVREDPGLTGRLPKVFSMTPAGGVNASLADMERWLLLQMGRGEVEGRRVAAEATMADAHAPHMVTGGDRRAPAGFPLGYPELSASCYGLGWTVSSYRGHRIVSHGGALGSLVAFLPHDDIGYAIVTNLSTSLATVILYRALDQLLGLEPIDWRTRFLEDQGALRAEQARALAARRPRRREGTSPSHSLGEYAGEYASPLDGKAVVTASGANLRLSGLGLHAALEHFHHDTFSAPDPMAPNPLFVTFGSDLGGGVGTVRVDRAPYECAEGEEILLERSDGEARRSAP